MYIKYLISVFALISILQVSTAQKLVDLKFQNNNGYCIVEFVGSDSNSFRLEKPTTLVSFEVCPPNQLDKKEQYAISDNKQTRQIDTDVSFENYTHGIKATIKFINTTADTIWLTNVVPFGTDDNYVYITGIGNHGLSRTHLFRPGFSPVNVIVPDNAWELGYGQRRLNDKVNVCALTRRNKESIQNGKRRRFETELYPEGSVEYTFYADSYKGDWQEGLRLMFQNRMLYDIEPGKFDNTLFEREDLSWIKHSYLNQAMMGWDHNFYDIAKGKYTLGDFIEFNDEVLGGAEIFGLWPTWPALGMDQRNQWDMFRSMPGGIEKLNQLAGLVHSTNSRFFIAFKPWDVSTRGEDPYEGLSEVVKKIDADGVVLDCSGASSTELRNAADRGKKGVVMYSEGMAVPKDMQGIVSGRVHNALYYCPVLNLNKLIKPDFAIFRVVELGKERIKREYNLSLFNGYGTENNMYNPGRPYWLEEQWNHLKRILMIQRENSLNFTSFNYTPLIPTLADNIYVNEWLHGDKTVYTIFSLRPEGINEKLFKVKIKEGYHYVDLWNHEETKLVEKEGKFYAVVDVEAFSKKWLGTNNEGAVGVIACFKKHLKTRFNLAADELTFESNQGNRIRIWAGMPDYQGDYRDYSINRQTIRLLKEFGRSEGKFVVQLFNEDDQLIDENIISFKPASARLASTLNPTLPAESAPTGMVRVPTGKFFMHEKFGDNFIPYPKPIYMDTTIVKSFFIDIHPVTNTDYRVFLEETGYQPIDKENFLKHWDNGKIKKGDENKPVVYVSYEDAQAYAKWAGKRLPTEMEWQYAAQAGDSEREWPWGTDSSIKKREVYVNNTLTVETVDGIDTEFSNPGNGKYEEIGKYPKGANPWGLQDLVGSVWQLTNDVYDNCSYSFIMLKGGSYFKAQDSWWYVQGGPQSLWYRQKLLRVSPGFERNATVGFRCVKDVFYNNQ